MMAIWSLIYSRGGPRETRNEIKINNENPESENSRRFGVNKSQNKTGGIQEIVIELFIFWWVSLFLPYDLKFSERFKRFGQSLLIKVERNSNYKTKKKQDKLFKSNQNIWNEKNESLDKFGFSASTRLKLPQRII